MTAEQSNCDIKAVLGAMIRKRLWSCKKTAYGTQKIGPQGKPDEAIRETDKPPSVTIKTLKPSQ